MATRTTPKTIIFAALGHAIPPLEMAVLAVKGKAASNAPAGQTRQKNSGCSSPKK